MAFRRALLVAALSALAAVVAAPASAQDKQDKPKLSKDEVAQYESIHKVVDAVQAGKQPAPQDFTLTMHPDFLKSNENVYIPFSLEVEPGKITSPPVVLYVRAIATGAAPAAAAPSASEKPAEGGAAQTYAWEDVSFLTPGPDNLLQRALALAPGQYDVYVAVAERAPKDKKAPPPKMTVMKQDLTVPDLQSGLTTSSVILATAVDPGTALNGQQQLQQPYMLSGYKVTVNPSRKYAKSGELLWVYYIYNEGATPAGKPDLYVDNNFFRAGEEKPFVAMTPSTYNASTNLPAEFNLSAGHTVFVAQGVPLSTFEPGDYKVQIKVSDKIKNESITRDVPFTVTP